MNDDKFNMEIRKFLKKVGITSQREIEKAVARALASGALAGNESLQVKATLEIGELDLRSETTGNIALE